MNDKISVIMGVYNTKDKKLLRKSIESILKQTYSNYEFIICNDCSSDIEVEKILNEYKEKDNRIVIINNKNNMGLAASLNECIKISKGEYIARQDDDDISYPTRFKEEIDFLKNNNQYDIVGCRMEKFDDNGIWDITNPKEKPSKKDFLKGTQFSHPTIIITKKCLQAVNGYRDLKYTRRTEDYDLFMRLYAKGYKGYNLPKVLYKYNESIGAYSKRKYKYRLDEYKVRIEGFKNLELMPIGFVWAFKPLIVGLIPKRLLFKIRKKKGRVN